MKILATAPSDLAAGLSVLDRQVSFKSGSVAEQCTLDDSRVVGQRMNGCSQEDKQGAVDNVC